MGTKWLHDAVAPLQAALGASLVLYTGYATRSRSTGGFEDRRGLLWHHAANRPGTDDNVINYEVNGSADRPVANFHVKRDGTVVFHTAGAANHAGKGGPVHTSRGPIPLNQGNLYLIGVEFSNDGVGEPWPDVQLENGLILFSTLCKTYGLNPLTDLFGHGPRTDTWVGPSCPGRKIDPAGPTPKYPLFGGTSGRNSWTIGHLRKEVYARTIFSPPVNPIPPKHTVKTLPDGMEDSPNRVDPHWGPFATNPNTVEWTKWLQLFFAEQGWYSGPIDGNFSRQFQDSIIYVQKAFNMRNQNGYYWQETAERLDAWARVQPWYNTI